MRHLGSLILGLLSAPVLWILVAIGWVKFHDGLNDDLAGQTALGFVVLLVFGVLLAALLLPRWSPVGPAAAGVLFLTMTFWAMIDLRSLLDLTRQELFGTGAPLSFPVGALSLLLSIPLLATVTLPHRWRGAVAGPARHPGAAGQPGYPAFAPTGPGGQFPPGAQPPPGGQFPPGVPTGHPPNYGPSANPSYGPSAPPNYGPSVPQNYGPSAPTSHGPPTPPYNAPAGPPYYGPSPTPGRMPAPQPPSSPISGPPVPGIPPTSAPPVPPGFNPAVPPPRSGHPGTGETTQFAAGPAPDDDGEEEATRRLGDR